MAINQPEHSMHPPPHNATIKRHYDRPPSFTDLLPWMEYIPSAKPFCWRTASAWGGVRGHTGRL